MQTINEKESARIQLKSHSGTCKMNMDNDFFEPAVLEAWDIQDLSDVSLIQRALRSGEFEMPYDFNDSVDQLYEL